MKKGKIKILVATLGMVSILGLSGCSTSNQKSDNTNPTKAVKADKSTSSKDTKKETSEKSGKVTYDDFSKVKIDMTYDEAKKILGEGTKDKDSNKMYSWGEDGKEIQIIYDDDGKATDISEDGLENNDTKVTEDQYNKIQSDQSYDDVKAIFGGKDGTIIRKTYGAHGDDDEYIWGNEKDGYIKVTFGDGKTSVKDDGVK